MAWLTTASRMTVNTTKQDTIFEGKAVGKQGVRRRRSFERWLHSLLPFNVVTENKACDPATGKISCQWHLETENVGWHFHFREGLIFARPMLIRAWSKLVSESWKLHSNQTMQCSTHSSFQSKWWKPCRPKTPHLFQRHQIKSLDRSLKELMTDGTVEILLMRIWSALVTIWFWKTRFTSVRFQGKRHCENTTIEWPTSFRAYVRSC